MNKLPSALSVSILSVTTPEDPGALKCVIYLGGQSVTVSVPSQAIRFENVSLKDDDILLLSVSKGPSEIGKCVIKLAQFLETDRMIDGEFLLAKAPPSKQELLQAVFTPGKVHIRVEPVQLDRHVKEKVESRLESQLIQLRAMLKESYESRDELSKWIKEASESFTQHQSKQAVLLQTTSAALQETQDALLEEQANNKQVTHTNRRMNTKLRDFKTIVASLNSQVKENTEKLKVNETCRALLTESWAERDSFRESYIQSTTVFENNTHDQDQYIAHLHSENAQMRKRIIELEQELHTCKSEKENTHASLLTVTNEVSALRSKLRVLQEQKAREKELEKLLMEMEKANRELQITLKNLRESSKVEFDKLKQNNGKLLIENKEINDQYDLLKKESTGKSQDLLQLQGEAQELRADLLRMEEHLCLQEDLNRKIDQLKKQNTKLHEHQSELLTDVEELSETVKNHEQTIEAAKTDIEHLQSENAHKEAEIKQLKTLLKARKPYFPDKEDPVDIAMADYVNTASPPVKVPLAREEQGIYLFGTKRVFVKLEHGKLIFRVGGGFMQIEDFLEVYSPVELEKYENKLRDQAQKIRKNLYGKYAKGMVSHKEKSISPERSGLGSSYTTYYAIQKRSTSPARASLSPPKRKKSRTPRAD